MKRELAIVAGVMFAFISCQSENNAKIDEAAETKEIMKTIENETSCFFARDYDCWKANFAQTDYAFQSWSNPDGTFDAKVGWSEIDDKTGKYIKFNPVKAGEKSVHPDIERRNMKVKFFSPNVAYMIWDQYNSDQSQKNFYHSKDTRIMEKIDGKWKIVNVSAFWDYDNLVTADSLKKIM